MEMMKKYGKNTLNKIKTKSNNKSKKPNLFFFIINESKKTSDSFSFSSLMDSVKKIDMNSVQKGINSMQKAIELLQGLTIGKAPSNAASTYQPRQVFKKFED